ERTDVASRREVKTDPSSFTWPQGGSSAIRQGDSISPTLEWRQGTRSGHIVIEDSASKVVAWSLRDIDGDGQQELVVFLAQRKRESFENQSTAWIFGTRESAPARMLAWEYALIGVSDEASLDRELRDKKQFALRDDTPTVRLLARLRLAQRNEI